MEKNKSQIYLFTDGSVHPQSGVGFGSYLSLDQLELSLDIEDKIKTKQFSNTSSTKLELETLLWALSDMSLEDFSVKVFTDCQNIIGLQDRRAKFEENNYMTTKGKQIKNHDLYKKFFKKIDSIDCDFIKVKGHKKRSTKNEIDDIFTLVDKATRKALRKSFY